MTECTSCNVYNCAFAFIYLITFDLVIRLSQIFFSNPISCSLEWRHNHSIFSPVHNRRLRHHSQHPRQCLVPPGEAHPGAGTPSGRTEEDDCRARVPHLPGDHGGQVPGRLCLRWERKSASECLWMECGQWFFCVDKWTQELACWLFLYLFSFQNPWEFTRLPILLKELAPSRMCKLTYRYMYIVLSESPCYSCCIWTFWLLSMAVRLHFWLHFTAYPFWMYKTPINLWIGMPPSR